MLSFFALSAILAIGTANEYKVTVDYFEFLNTDLEGNNTGFYLFVSAHRQNGEEVDGFTTKKIYLNDDVINNRIETDTNYTFSDDGGAPITQFFVQLYNFWDKEEFPDSKRGYSNSFFQIESDICSFDDSKDMQLWFAGWEYVGRAKVLLEAVNECETPTTTTIEPYNDNDGKYGNMTYERCELWSYNTDWKVDCDDDSDSEDYHWTREYYGECPSCPKQIIRTGEFGARKCGHDAWWPDDMGHHWFLVLPCEYGMFKIDDGAAGKNILTVIVVAVIALINV